MSDQPPQQDPQDRWARDEHELRGQLDGDMLRLKGKAISVLGTVLIIALGLLAGCQPQDTSSSGASWGATWTHDPAGATRVIDYLAPNAIKYLPNRDDFAAYGGKQEIRCTTDEGRPGVRVKGTYWIPPSRYPAPAPTPAGPARLLPAAPAVAYPHEVPDGMEILIRAGGFRVAEDDRPAGRPRVTYTRPDGFTAEINADDAGIFKYSFTSSCF